MSLLKLFLIFTKIGAILLGGGYVILPILMNEFVEKRKLITNEELVDYFALSQSMPGIIAANISMFVGYKLKGKSGALIAMLGVVFVPFISIVFLASVLDKFVTNQYVQAAFWGVGIAVIALIVLTVREMWQKSEKNIFFYVVYILALLTLIVLKLSPIITILLFVILGVLYKRLFAYKEAD
ncbi:chromate transporter [bacterium]|nr:chromate transporter [bacterium]